MRAVDDPTASSLRCPTPIEALSTLELNDRMAVELVAVFSAAATMTNITRGLGKVGCRVANRSPKNDDTLRILSSLKDRGFITDKNYYAVPECIAHSAMLSAARGGRLENLAAVVRELQPARGSERSITTWALAVREIRIELHGRHWDAARALARELPRHIFHDVCKPFDRDWLMDFPADLRRHALAGVAEKAITYLEPVDTAFSMFEAESELTDPEHRILVEQLILRGRFDEAERQLTGRTSLASKVSRAFLLLVRGHIKESITAYEAALIDYLKMAGKRGGIFPDRAGLFFVVALIAEGSATSITRATTLAGSAKKSHALQGSYAMLSEVLSVFAGDTEPEALYFITRFSDLDRVDPIEMLVLAACALWAHAKPSQWAHAELEKRIARAEAAGLRWYSEQARDLLAALSGKPQEKALAVDGIRLSTLVSARERWADTLSSLLEIASAEQRTTTPTVSTTLAARRLVWIVSNHPYGITLEPREQTRTKQGWSKGKPVALKRLSEDAKTFGYLTSADLAVCATIEATTTYESYGRYPRVNYNINSARALLCLHGCDNVLVEESVGAYEPCEIRRAAPRLEVTKHGDRLSLSLVPRPRSNEESLTLVMSDPRAVEIVEFAPIHHRLARTLGSKGLEVPSVGEKQLRAALHALSSRVSVQADLEGDAGDADTLRGDTRPCFLLRALGEGLSVAAQIRPLGAEGPLVRSGRGGATLFTQFKGQSTRVLRDLTMETQRLENALALCPILTGCQSADTDFVLPTRSLALEALLELRALGSEVELEWPDGGDLKVTRPLGIEDFRWEISSKAGSFIARGTLAVPEHAELEIAEIADYLSASPGRFLQLAGDEKYIALTTELRARLDEILGLCERSSRGLRIHPLSATSVAELFGGSHVEGDKAWLHHVERFTASGVEVELPSTLQGELRPYQLEGFRWLVRLSRWGAGGCLADDMGLGKTLQTIALLLHRAPEGPALVVAPTSVVPTWVDEALRFAPTLRVRTFAGASRAKELEDLGAFDLLVASYGVVQLDIDALVKIDFATVVLDEAQVIKNAETLRARAVVRLQARLRIATTGTPIENRLEDLHSIFSFLNPGFLGSAQGFQARFARPIERDRDPRARAILRKLIAPFVLRRTKTEVLPELPSRTEVTLRVPLELAEMAIYELIREEALAQLTTEPRASRAAGSARLQILAAIMRLRQAASNARLVLPDSEAPSAKLAALGELLDDLLPSHHKVLIFSQFVSHLSLVKEMLDARGVKYQYLDGSTPMAARKTSVDDFQAGQGEVFLISLKAGGFGLNLTAADYVVHMDPWWNPATEDQASDRAHRIGQTRPVTIYRLVAQDTIEDKILGLHHRKRELAAEVLEGSDLAGRMSEADLLELIRGPS